MARLIGDGGMAFHTKGFAAFPSHQGEEIGIQLLRALEQHKRDTVGPGWAVDPELIRARETVPIYRRMGFEERPCERGGPDMMKTLRQRSGPPSAFLKCVPASAKRLRKEHNRDRRNS